MWHRGPAVRDSKQQWQSTAQPGALLPLNNLLLLVYAMEQSFWIDTGDTSLGRSLRLISLCLGVHRSACVLTRAQLLPSGAASGGDGLALVGMGMHILMERSSM